MAEKTDVTVAGPIPSTYISNRWIPRRAPRPPRTMTRCAPQLRPLKLSKYTTMPHSTQKQTVSMSEFDKLAKATLEEYSNYSYVSAELEKEYLGRFIHIRSEWKRIWGERMGCTLYLDSDTMMFHKLPRRLRLYRGYYESAKREGISWSLSRKVAEGFAYSLWNYKKEAPQVVTATCLRSRVLAYTNDGSEQECIVDPKDVRSIHNIKVREKPPFPVSAEPLEELLKGRQHHGSEIIKAD